MEISHIFVFCLLIAVVAARPQFPLWNEDLTQTFIRGQPVTSPRPSTTAQPTTASPRMLACIQTCPATSEYNPICGSDGVNYYNEGRLNCAIRCGQNVRSVHLGVCSTT
ncbi:uncharacterized protein LOC6577240 [Drosophila mojavensis]|uniref:Kazal-like domain-containing protein n=1 Tax=Drosophila mojavensis TaxID=7230 RepID=B4KKB8_DROMO|nr:uncharacterized protein LOC6577240 [Drosophila mojavensis]EDW12649.1 uncharacterized protein Dmoj_GI17786 [Drosophila mojavensis]